MLMAAVRLSVPRSVPGDLQNVCQPITTHQKAVVSVFSSE